MIVLNDIHIGFSRQGGTTPASRDSLRRYLLDSLQSALFKDDEHDTLVIAGDLFDAFEVDGRDWLDTFMILSHWLANENGLVLVAGNHDWSPKGEKVSSFQMLVAALGANGSAFTVVNIDEYTKLVDGVWAIAHCSNQDIFDMKMGELLDQVGNGDVVLLHANFDNNFAAQSDHSLNVSREMARKFVDKGVTLLFAHEHQARSAFDNQVVCMGNQWPTSIADCLNNDQKYLHHIHEGTINKVKTWSIDDDVSGFTEIDWRDLDKPTKAGFIRVTGTATANEASDVMTSLAAYRKESTAFVITNMVKIAGIAEAAALPEAFEATARFDVMDYIKDNVTPEEMVVVNKLLEQA